MKKFFQLITILSLSILNYACSKDNNTPYDLNQNIYELEAKLVLNSSTSDISPLFLNMGVTEIEVIKDQDSKLYHFKTEKVFSMNGQTIDLSEYPMIFENGMISFKYNPKISLTIVDGQPYVVSPNYTGIIDNANYFQNFEFNILLLFMKEMITENSQKIDATIVYDRFSQKSGCSFWNTWYVYATGGSRNVALQNLQTEISLDAGPGGDVEGCRKLGDPDASCFFDNHGCVATQAYCCD